MTTDPFPPEGAAARPRAFTVRALVIGIGLSAAMAWLTPWNDWYVHNAYLYNNFLPPVVTTLLLVIALAVNPALGRRRLARGELAVIAALLLSTGGLASSGFARYWSVVVAGPARKLVREPNEALKTPLDERTQAALVARLRSRDEADFVRLDIDHDGRLGADEVWGGSERIARDDRDGDLGLSREEYVAGRLAGDTRAFATWRWALPSDLFLGIPEAGPIDPNDPEYQRIVDGYLDGAHSSPSPRVGHRALVTWRGPDAVVHARDLALAGEVRESFARAGTLDLGSRFGEALIGHRAGDSVATALGPVEVLAVEAPPRVPWSAWIGAALAWSPLVVGLCLASVACAFVVRRQWIEHERLAYPLSSATFALIDDPAPGTRLPPVLRVRAFWIAAGIACFIVVWRGLEVNHLVPITIALEVPLYDQLSGHPWWDGVGHWCVAFPHVYFTFIGLAFLVPLELSFGLWFFLIATYFLTMFLRTRGISVDAHDVKQFAFGSWSTIAGLILWLGRSWYLRVLRAAVGLSGDEAARAAAPWLWALLAGMGLMAAWMIVHGAPAGAACAITLAFFGFLLVIARGLAEAGIPMAVFPENFDGFLYATVGFGLPAAALLPMAIIGMCLTDPREALLPYATSASYLGERAAAPPRRLGAAMTAMAIAAAVIACASVVFFAYTRNGHEDGYAPYAYNLDDIARRAVSDPSQVAQLAAGHRSELTAIGLGAGVTALLGVGRVLWTWWPLHPLPLAFALCYTSEQGWMSFFVAWLAKLLVMRYGGVGVYRRLVPAAIGLAAGEAVGICLFTVAKIIVTGILGQPMPAYVHALPG